MTWGLHLGKIRPLIHHLVVNLAHAACFVYSRACHNDELVIDGTSRVAVAGVVHISASAEAELVVFLYEFSGFAQTTGIHVKLAASNHVNHSGGAKLDELEVVRKHLLVALALVLGVNAI